MPAYTGRSTVNEILRRRTKIAAAILAVGVVSIGVVDTAQAQGRTARKIRVPEKAATTSGVTPDQCRAAVHDIARRWGSENLRQALHPDFPNRSELLDAVRRSTLRGTNVALAVEAVEGTRLVPSKDGRSTDCIADVSTRLQFDDPATGQRQSGNPGRAQWRIRFEPRR